jgi:hypothetical protein
MRSWLKVYPSKVSCLTELESAKLAATGDSFVISTQKEPCWVIHTITDSDLLTMLGFVEQRQLRIQLKKPQLHKLRTVWTLAAAN